MFLWRGSPNPSLIQRIVAWLMGSIYLTTGVVLVMFARAFESLFYMIFALLWIALGTKVFANGCRRHKETSR